MEVTMDNKQKEKKHKNIRASIFFIVLVTVIIFSDLFLTTNNPVGRSTLFNKNDFEKIKLAHPEQVYNKALYGNSVVISAFIEEESQSGYVNMGMDYATIEDLSKILDKNMVQVDTDLVLGVNYLSFLDTFDTNPTYPWHRKVYEPYLYFQRDRLHDFITSGVGRVLKGEKFVTTRYTNLNRYVYHGILPTEELDKKIEQYEKLYWNKGIEYYEKNFIALQNVIDYCKEKDIELRCIFLPWNDYISKPVNVVAVEDRAKEILRNNGIEFIDFEGAYTGEYFHDLGHLNYEYGAVEFTKEIDKWLIRE